MTASAGEIEQQELERLCGCRMCLRRSRGTTSCRLDALRSVRRDIRRQVCHGLVLHDAERRLMVCQVCGGTGLGGASVVHERDCALGDLTDTWPGSKVLRRPQRERLDT